MKTKELIARLKKCPQESEVYFDNLEDGLVPVDAVMAEFGMRFIESGSICAP